VQVYPQAELWDEIVYLAYHLHWDLNDLVELDHGLRVELVERVADLNRRALESARSLVT